ncbi:MAG: HIT family protein [Nanoarchaeota archaeon]|nr:HIT family protein [Nanoarchaeota archaeon]MBU1622815.1 HIT family protein [Nanoarchaeota archaeon]
MKDCLFCKIVKKEIPCHNIYEDKNNLAFLDIQPHAQGHTVVISKTHAPSITELEDQKLQSLIIAVKKAMKLIKEKLSPTGFTIGINHGKISGQTVDHLHIHILPRYEGDGGGNVHSIIKNPGDKSVEEVAELFK